MAAKTGLRAFLGSALQQWAIRPRTLVALCAIVLIAHYALLYWARTDFHAKPETASGALSTRRIVLPPAPALEPVVAKTPPDRPPAPVVPPKPLSPPVLKEKRPQTQQNRAQAATEIIANEVPATAPVAPPPEPLVPPASVAAASSPDAPPSNPELRPAAEAAVTAPEKTVLYRFAESAVLSYDAVAVTKGQPLRASGKVVWQHDGSAYQARLEGGVFLVTLLEQTSEGRMGPAGLEPDYFSDKRRRGTQATHFERDKGQISFSNNKPSAALLVGAQDRLSVIMQVAALLAGEPPLYGSGSTLHIQTAGVDDADVWTFTVEGDETLSLPVGEVIATKLSRLPRREYDQKVELWFAPSLGYVPVRIRLTAASGDHTDFQLRRTDKP